MVQRKVPSKLGIQADHVKSLGPSSPRHQDGKNRGGDLKKKKMKKSRSIKHSDFESLRSPIFTSEVAQPGKPPPQQKQSPIKGSDASPNYMKSTSSFDARKDRSQSQIITSRISPASIDGKSSKKIPNNSKFTSASGHKPAKALTRTSSLKLVRTLTKSPSFKPARCSTKKCSQVVLCENLNVERATCSSTLKDSEFPTYLALAPGATESQGTSVMKVCPYTYCSLNGHHHAPLPPLKCFLSARRCMLKTQKSIMKPGCVSLSPRQAKPSGDGMKEMILYEKPAIQEQDLNSSAISPLAQEDQMDFFVEIYVKDMEDAAETINGSKENLCDDDKDRTTYAALDNFMPSVAECFPHEAPCSEIDGEDNIDESSEFISAKMEIADFFPEEQQNVEAAEAVYSPCIIQEEEETPEGLSNQIDLEVKNPESSEFNESDSETSDMEWEEDQTLDDEVGNSTQTNDEFDFKSGSSYDDDDHPSFGDEPIFKSDHDIVSSYFDEIPIDEGLGEFFEEEGESSGAGCSNSNSNSDLEGPYQNLGSNESIQAINNQNHDLVRDGYVESDDFVPTATFWVPLEESIGEPREAIEDESKVLEADNEKPRVDLQPGDEKKESTNNIKDEVLIDSHEENESLEDKEASALLGLGNQESDLSHNFTELGQGETYEEDCSSSDKNTEIYQSDVVSEEIIVENLLTETKYSETNQSLKQELPTADVGDGMEEKEREHDAAKTLIRIPTFDLLKGLCEANQDMAEEQDNNEIQLGVTYRDIGESNQASSGECLPEEIQVHSFDKQSQSFKIPASMDSEDQTHSGLNKVSIAENSNEDVNEMEVEYSTMSDPEESAKIAANSNQAKTAFFHGGRSHSSEEEQLKAPNNLRIFRCKSVVEDLEESRKFNLREPNYLPIEVDPEAEKVDLRHQTMEERKNAEEWMIDYALQKAVTKLAPARKRKVALLVEAFEKVMPIPKYESHLRPHNHTSAPFAHATARPIQACS